MSFENSEENSLEQIYVDKNPSPESIQYNIIVDTFFAVTENIDVTSLCAEINLLRKRSLD